MAKTKHEAEVKVNFRSAGLDNIEKEVLSFSKKLPALTRSAEAIDNGGLAKYFSNAQVKLTELLRTLNKAYSDKKAGLIDDKAFANKLSNMQRSYSNMVTRVSAEALKLSASLDLKSQGLLQVGKEAINLSNKLVALKKTAESIGAKQFIKDIETADSKLNKLYSDLSDVSSAKSEGRLDDGAFTVQANKIISSIKQTEAHINGITNALKNHNSTIKNTVKDNLKYYEALGGSKRRADELKAAIKNMDVVMSKPGGTDYFRKISAELEKEIKYLKTIEGIRKDINKAGLGSDTTKDLRAKMTGYKSALMSKKTSSAEKDQIAKEMQKLGSLITKVTGKQDTLNEKIKSTNRLYNLTGDEVAALNNDIRKAAESALKSGKISDFKVAEDAIAKVTKAYQKQAADFSKVTSNMSKDVVDLSKKISNNKINITFSSKGLEEVKKQLADFRNRLPGLTVTARSLGQNQLADYFVKAEAKLGKLATAMQTVHDNKKAGLIDDTTFKKKLSGMERAYSRMASVVSQRALSLSSSLDLKSMGLKTVLGDAVKVSNKIVDLKRIAVNIGTPHLVTDLELADHKLNNLAGDLSMLIRKFSEGKLNDSQFVTSATKIIGSIKQTEAQVTGITNALKTHNSTIGETVKANVRYYESMGGNKARIDEVKNALANMKTVMSKPGGTDYFRKISTELEKEIKYLKTIQSIRGNITPGVFSPATAGDLATQLDAYKTKLTDPKTAPGERGVLAQDMKELGTQITAAVNKQAMLNKKIAIAKDLYGLTDSEVLKLNGDIKAAADHAAKTGSNTAFKDVESSINNTINTYKKHSTEFHRLTETITNDVSKIKKELGAVTLPPSFKATLDRMKASIENVANDPLVSKKTLARTRGFSKQLASVLPKLTALENRSHLLVGKLKALGVEQTEITEITDVMGRAFVKSAREGNTATFNVFNQNLREVVTNIEAGIAAGKKLGDFNLKPDALRPKETEVFKVMAKDAAALDRKMIQLERSYEQQIGSIDRMIASKKRWAKAGDISKAIKYMDSLKKKYEEVKRVQNELTTGVSSGNISGQWLTDHITKANKLEHSFQKDVEKAKELKAKLSELSSVKWGTNIVKRAIAYAGLYASIYQVIGAIKRGMAVVLDFDKSMRTMAAVLDISAAKAAILETRLIGLAKAWGGGVKEIEEAAMALGRAGIESEHLIKGTEVVIKMAKLTGDTISVSSSALITYQQVFGQAGRSLEELGDQLAYVANQSRLSTQDIGTYSNYALAAAKASGFTMEAVNAMATSFSNAGVNASTIGTQIRRFTSLLRDNSTAAQEFFLKLGTTQKFMRESFAQGGDASDRALMNFAKKLKSLSNIEFSKTIQGMDILASQSITLLRNNSNEFLRHFTRLREGVDGELAKSDYIAQSYADTWDKVKASVGEAFAKIAEKAMPYLVEMGESIVEMLGKFDEEKVKKFFTVMENSIKAVTTAFTLGLVASVVSGGVAMYKVLKGLINQFVILRGLAMLRGATGFAAIRAGLLGLSGAAVGGAASVGMLTTAFGYLKTAMLFFTKSPWGLALVAIGAGIAAIFASTSTGTKKLVKETKTAMTELKSIGDAILENDTAIRNKRKELWEIDKQLTTANEKTEKVLIKKKALIISEIVYMQNANKHLQVKLSLQDKEIELAKARQDLAVNTERVNSELAAGSTLNASNLAIAEQSRQDSLEKILSLEKQIKLIKLTEKYDIAVHKVRVLTKATEGFKDKVTAIGFSRWETELEKAKREANQLKGAMEGIRTQAEGTGKAMSVVMKKEIDRFVKLASAVQKLAEAGDNTKNSTLKVLTSYAKNIESFNASMGDLTGNMLEKVQEALKTSMADEGLKQAVEAQIATVKESLANFIEEDDVDKKVGLFRKLQVELISLQDTAGNNTTIKSAIGSIDEEVSRAIDSMLTIVAAKEKMLVATSKQAASLVKADMSSLKTDIKNALTSFNLGENVSKEYANIMERMNRLYQDMLNRAKSDARASAITMMQVIDEELAKAKIDPEIFSEEDIKAIKEAREELKNVKDGKSGPKAAKLAVDKLNSILKTSTGSAGELAKKLKALSGMFAGLLGQMTIIQGMEVKFTGDLTGAKDMEKGTNALKNLTKAGKNANNMTKEQSKRFLAAKAAAEAFSEKLKLVNNDIGASNTAVKDMKKAAGDASGKVKKFTNSLEHTGKAAGGAAKKLSEMQTALREVNRTIAENLGLGTMKFDIADDTAAITEKIKKAGLSQTKFQEWRASEMLAKKDLLEQQRKEKNESPGGDPMGMSNFLKIQEQYDEQASVINKYWDNVLAYSNAQETILNEQHTSNQMEQDLIDDQLRDIRLQKEEAFFKRKADLQKNHFNTYVDFAGDAVQKLSTTFELLNQAGYLRDKKWFMFKQALAVTSAIISTYKAAADAADNYTWPYSAIAIAATIAQGMAQVAVIKSQTMPKYHTGGYVDDKYKQDFHSGDARNQVMGGLKDDEIPAILQKGEYVLTGQEVAKVKNAQGGVGQGTTNVNVAAPAAPAPEIVIINSVSGDALEEWATSRSGREVINNVVN